MSEAASVPPQSSSSTRFLARWNRSTASDVSSGLNPGAHAHQPELGRPEAHADKVLLPLGDGRLQVGEEALREGFVRAAHDVREVLLGTHVALLVAHPQRNVQRLHDLPLRVGVDAQAAVEHAREARELGDERPRREAAEVARQHKLERVQVDGLTQRGDAQHLARAPQPQPLRRRHAAAHLEVHGARVGRVDPVDDTPQLGLDGGRSLDLDAVARLPHTWTST